MSQGPVPAADAGPGRPNTATRTAINISAEPVAKVAGERRLRGTPPGTETNEDCTVSSWRVGI
ncbi:hypothetical protein GCM10017744_003440 [Streptomyces antimycoticus]|uniref:Uncharacterized protein n=1 Tax=Streptomyces antimycoticus TaxID=68175 RepID=A0A4D4KSB6_9ACTN|nr:hypothetical protein SANT12839_096210 [Streptomyces antimycoticus]